MALKEGRKNITTSIDTETIQQIKKYAKEENRTVSNFVLSAVKFYLKHISENKD